MVKIWRALAMCLVLFAACPAHAQAEDDESASLDDTPHMTITGTASAEVVPDIAEISLGVSTEKPRAPDATAETARIARDIIDAAKAQSVESRDIRTQSITLTQTFDNVNDANGHFISRKPRGFSAGTVIVIRTRALDKAGALAQSLIDKGATNLNAIDFALEHPDRILDTLLAAAVRDAKRQAEIAAGAAGIKLGRILLIEKPEAAAPRPLVRALAAPAKAVLPVEPGTETLRNEISVTWAVAP